MNPRENAETIHLTAHGVRSLRDLVPPALDAEWRARAREVRRASLAAIAAAPIAVARAERVADVPAETRAKYLREIGEVPELRRLRENQRFMETIDDPYLPGGLYERPVLRLYRHLGWYAASVYWIGLRNRGYQAAWRHRFEHAPGRTLYAVYGEATMGRQLDDGNIEPFRAGEWLCIAYVDGHPRAFEYARIWEYNWLRGRAGHYREGWKLRPLAEGDRPEQPTATGILQRPSLRPLQKREF